MPLILASAVSRLHADLIIVRLKQAAIPTNTISVLHPLSCSPNSAACWLEGAMEVDLSSGPTVAVAGQLGERLSASRGRGTFDLAKGLWKLGLNAEECATIEETLLETRFVLAVELANPKTQNVVLEILRRVTAERVILVADGRPAGHPSDFETALAAAEADTSLSVDFTFAPSTGRTNAAQARMQRASAKELTNLLSEACAELHRLEICAEDMGQASALPSTTHIRPNEIAVLRTLADEGQAAIVSRLRALGAEIPEFELSRPALKGAKASRSIRSLVAVYRKCSRRLCAALLGARESSDAATAAVLRSLILRLEKQLWLLDSLSGSAQEDRSVLGIFSAC